MADKKATKETKNNKVSKKNIKKTNKQVDAKLKKAKLNDKYDADSASEIKRFIYILLAIIIVILIVYGVTKLFSDETTTTTTTVTEGEIDYDKVIIGNMLSRSETEYYVMIYDLEDSKAVLYSSIISIYDNSDDAIKIYYCDLGSLFNESYYVGSEGESNPNATSIDELALSDLTLIKVKNGKIAGYYEGLDAIKSELGI